MARGFWPVDLGRRFDCIVAQNVLGHVDDARGFLAAIAQALQPGGVAIIEVPWVVPLICEGRWDTIYHEHLSYWGLGPLSMVAKRAGLDVNGWQYLPDLHGGTVRFNLGRAVKGAVLIEKQALSVDDFGRFAIRAYGDMKRWDKILSTTDQQVAAYGSSAKLNTFLNALPNRPRIVGVFDDSPAKQNLYTPGWHYPVLVPTPMVMREVNVLLIGSPNWAPEIEAKARALGFAGEVKSLWT